MRDNTRAKRVKECAPPAGARRAAPAPLHACALLRNLWEPPTTLGRGCSGSPSTGRLCALRLMIVHAGSLLGRVGAGSAHTARVHKRVTPAITKRNHCAQAEQGAGSGEGGVCQRCRVQDAGAPRGQGSRAGPGAPLPSTITLNPCLKPPCVGLAAPVSCVSRIAGIGSATSARPAARHALQVGHIALCAQRCAALCLATGCCKAAQPQIRVALPGVAFGGADADKDAGWGYL